MTKRKAIDLLSDGHTIYTVKKAKEICKTIGLELPQKLIFQWKNRKDALKRYGFYADKDEPASGVYSLRLSDWACKELTGKVAGAIFHGRGSQARANSEAIYFKIILSRPAISP